MSFVVLSKNIYLSRGIYFISHGVEQQVSRCYLDISSFKSLREIRETVTKSIDNQYEIILLSGRDVCSRLFSSLNSFSLLSPLNDFESLFIYTYEFFMEYLDSLMALKRLTTRQHEIAKVLMIEKTIRRTAQRLKIKEKILYNYTRDVAAIMHFRSGCDLVNNIHVLM